MKEIQLHIVVAIFCYGCQQSELKQKIRLANVTGFSSSIKGVLQRTFAGHFFFCCKVDDQHGDPTPKSLNFASCLLKIEILQTRRLLS